MYGIALASIAYTIPLESCSFEQHTTTFINPHANGINAARELTAWQHVVNQCTADSWYIVASATPEVIKSFRPERITQCFFGDATLLCNQTITLSGSQTSRSDKDWLADYVGLPSDYVGKVHFRPIVTSYLLDLNAYIGLNNIYNGLYARIHAPIENTRWDLNLCEAVFQNGTVGYNSGYFGPESIERELLFRHFCEYSTGKSLPSLPGDITIDPLRYAKMSSNSLSKTAVADVEIAIGWNFLCSDWYHFGINLRSIIPTGNRPNAQFLFEPIIGGCHHWQIGVGFTSHLMLWQSCDEREKAEIYADFNITHQFSSRQWRSFDLKQKPNSRYMLAAEYKSTITNNLRGDNGVALLTPIAQFNNHYAPVANLTTFPVNVSIGIQADLALFLVYTKQETSWMFGYGFWGRSCEKIRRACPQTPLDTSLWALKGDASMIGFESTTNIPIQLSATNSLATIHGGTNSKKHGNTTPSDIALQQTNPTIDNALIANSDTANSGTFQVDLSQPNGSDTTHTSVQPVFLSTCDIDMHSAQTYGMSHRIIGEIDYTWDCYRPWTFYVGFGAEVEFGRNAQKKAVNKEQKCINGALSFWGLWLKGGFAFN